MAVILLEGGEGDVLIEGPADDPVSCVPNSKTVLCVHTTCTGPGAGAGTGPGTGAGTGAGTRRCRYRWSGTGAGTGPVPVPVPVVAAPVPVLVGQIFGPPSSYRPRTGPRPESSVGQYLSNYPALVTDFSV